MPACMTTNWQVFVFLLLLHGLASLDDLKRCTTTNQERGICVAQRFCRHSVPVLVLCSNKPDFYCCPFPGAGTDSEDSGMDPVAYPDDTDQGYPDMVKYPTEEEPDFMHYVPTKPTEPPIGRRGSGSNHNRERNVDETEIDSTSTRDHDRRMPSTKTEPTTIPSVFSTKADDTKWTTSADGRPMKTTLPQESPEPGNNAFEPACGQAPYDKFIAGGRESLPNRWPWMVAIFQRFTAARPKKFLCGGSLINNKFVLTAGHCCVTGRSPVPLPASSFSVKIGSGDLNRGEEYSISEVIVHSNFSYEGQYNDIALMKLSTEIPSWTDVTAPVCLPYPNLVDTDLVDMLATVVGWGVTALGADHENRLHEVTLPIVSLEDCALAYSRIRGAAFLARGSTHVLCAGIKEGGRDSCKSDSGGPLMLKLDEQRWTIIGIVSFGYRCAEPGFPGVYTRITHYLEWIYANTHK